jgi:hypothetical protein
MHKTKPNYDRKPTWRIPRELPTTRSMLRFLLQRLAKDARYDGHNEQSLLEQAAEWANSHGLTVDETLYLYCR